MCYRYVLFKAINTPKYSKPCCRAIQYHARVLPSTRTTIEAYISHWASQAQTFCSFYKACLVLALN